MATSVVRGPRYLATDYGGGVARCGGSDTFTAVVSIDEQAAGEIIELKRLGATGRPARPAASPDGRSTTQVSHHVRPIPFARIGGQVPGA